MALLDEKLKHSLEAFDSNSTTFSIPDEQTTHLLSGTNTAPAAQRHIDPLEYVIHGALRGWRSRKRQPYTCRRCIYTRRSLLRKFKAISYIFSAVVLLLVVITFTLFPSYTIPPPHYRELKKNVSVSVEPGRGNTHKENVFIAASLFDPGGLLVGGKWGENVVKLIELLGPENTYLSIYENDSGPEARHALSGLDEKLKCNHTLTFEDHLSLEEIPHVIIPDGTSRVKRIAYLAEVRNKALSPLDDAEILFDKVLYLNDVLFDPVDALQLLFSTHANQNVKADYRAACAMDFINPFKFYDTFATRDLGGWAPGVPFFPWVAHGGDSRSHSDILQEKDAVRVRSCWGGMVAFDAKFFERQPAGAPILATAGNESPDNITAPYRFRAERDLYWDASECCLIQADIQSTNPDDTGIYMNPYVRCAYGAKTLSLLWITQRIERLYTPIHFMIDILVSLPRFNARRDEQPWQRVEENVWVPDLNSPEGGSFLDVSRYASHAGFCGRRSLPVMKEHFTPGERYYEHIPIPSS